MLIISAILNILKKDSNFNFQFNLNLAIPFQITVFKEYWKLYLQKV